MLKKFDFNLKSTVWLTSSTLFIVGLIFGLLEASIIMLFYHYLPFVFFTEKALFFLFCILIYPVVFGLLGILLGGVSYLISQGYKRTVMKVSPELFLIAFYLFVGVLILVGLRVESIIEDYSRKTVYLQESVIACLAVFMGVICISIFGFFLSKFLKNSTSKAPISVGFIISVLILGAAYSFVKVNGNVAKAADVFKPVEKISSKTSLNTNSPLLDLGKTNVVLITIDTLRADHLSCYGYKRNTSPNIDNLAKKGIIFTKAETQKTSTAPSLASVLTGTYTNRHLVNRNGVSLQGFNITLPETLKKYGYKTATFLSNPVLGNRFGFRQGFDYFGDLSDLNKDFKEDELVESRQLNKMIIPWLEKNYGQKFFLWIHYRDPHSPYIVPAEYERLYVGDELYGKHKNKNIKIGDSYFGEIKHNVVLNGSTDIDYYISQYDAEIKFNDDSIGELFDVFEQLKLFENTLIILTADHGESLGEHNYYFSHGDNAYEPTSWVPLIIYHPLLPEGKVVSNVVELVDIYPTIVNLLRLYVEPQVQGKSLLPIINNDQSSASGFEYARTVGSWHVGYETNSIRNERWKLIYDVDEYWVYFDRIVEARLKFWRQKNGINPYRSRVYKTELYDLDSDPGETRNLSPSELPVEDRLRTLLFEWTDSGNYQIDSKELYDEKKLDKDTLEMLKALGYVN